MCGRLPLSKIQPDIRRITGESEDGGMAMCKRHQYKAEDRESKEVPYEGETRRLDPQQTGAGATYRRASHAHFPWWTLWLIWPLIYVVKGMVRVLADAATAIGGAVSTIDFGGLWLLPIILIVAGIVLLRRR
jgi:hypothetical protein